MGFEEEWFWHVREQQVYGGQQESTQDTLNDICSILSEWWDENRIERAEEQDTLYNLVVKFCVENWCDRKLLNSIRVYKIRDCDTFSALLSEDNYLDFESNKMTVLNFARCLVGIEEMYKKAAKHIGIDMDTWWIRDIMNNIKNYVLNGK